MKSKTRKYLINSGADIFELIGGIISTFKSSFSFLQLNNTIVITINLIKLPSYAIIIIENVINKTFNESDYLGLYAVHLTPP